MSTSSHGGQVRTSSKFTGVQLLIALAAGLCGLVVWQWIRDSDSHETNLSLVRTIERLGSVTNAYALTIENMRIDSSRVEEIRKGLEFQIKTNRAEVRRLRQELGTAVLVAERSGREIPAYKLALERANQAIRDQNVAVARQNESLEALRRIALDRNDLAKKYNTLGKEYESLIQERNGFVEQLNKLAQTASGKN